MQRAGIQIEKALGTVTKEVWPGIVAMVSEMTPKDMQWCLWYAKSYKKTLKALMKLDDFAGETQELHIRILPAEAPRIARCHTRRSTEASSSHASEEAPNL